MNCDRFYAVFKWTTSTDQLEQFEVIRVAFIEGAFVVEDYVHQRGEVPSHVPRLTTPELAAEHNLTPLRSTLT